MTVCNLLGNSRKLTLETQFTITFYRTVDKELRDADAQLESTNLPVTVETKKDAEAAEGDAKPAGIFEAVKRAVTRSED